MSGLPPLEDAEPFVGVLGEVQVEVTTMGSMEVITIRNHLTGEFECHYQM